MNSLKPAHLSRYATIARLLVKYGHGDLVRHTALDEAVARDAAVSTERNGASPQALADDLERLGPTFIKLGQLLSTRADFLPEEYLDALVRLQDDVAPLPYEVISEVVESELGTRISKAFAEFDTTAIATASIGQVHRARLRNDRRVAVKVQRPDLRQQVKDDLDAMQDLSSLLDGHTQFGKRIRFVQIVEALREVMAHELDYRQEAANARALRHNLQTFEQFYVPEIIDDYSAEKVITLEYVEGAKITDLSPMVLLDVDRQALADGLFRIYLHQVLVDGVFHADPHPGNLLLMPDHRIALIDFGMVARVTPDMQRHLVKLLMALADGRGDEAGREAIAIGTPYHKGQFREEEFLERVGKIVANNQGRPLKEVQAGRVLMELNGVAGETGLKCPNAIVMLGKTLLNLEKVVEALDPAFDPNAALKRHTNELVQRHSAAHLSLGRVYDTLLESAELLERLPERVNRFTDLVASNKLKITVDAFNEQQLIAGLQKIANRITTGIVIASLIVGASLLMRGTPASNWFGYPALPLVFFVTSALAGFALLWQICFRDESTKKR